ncbi:MAG: glycosyltransferase family 4 protein [Methanomassiliicoccales archaeon]|nr:glycosyltransferase family 4 protein [Methanomassiliicoccales archaeon]
MTFDYRNNVTESERLRVLIVGGFIDYQIQLANSLVSNGWEVEVAITRKSIPEDYENCYNDGINIYPIGRGKSKRDPSNIFALLEFWSKLRKFNPDVVHMQLGGTFTDFSLLPMLRIYPLVTTFHDVKLHRGEASLRRRFYRYWLRRASDHIFVHGDFLKSQMISEYNVNPDIVHPIAFGEHEVDPFIRNANINQEEVDNTVLFFGRIFEYKGLDYLIKAEPMISEEVPGVRFVIAGVGEDISRYLDMMVHRDRFDVRNYRISYEEGAKLFQECSLVVLPYIDGSQSGIIPTAYAFKKPLVATSIGGIPELIDDGSTGILVPPKEVGTLARAIIKLLRDKELRQSMGEMGFRKLKTDMSWERIADRTITIYNQAMTQR